MVLVNLFPNKMALVKFRGNLVKAAGGGGWGAGGTEEI